MWTQWWVVHAQDESSAKAEVQAALEQWTPVGQDPAAVRELRIYRGTDDLALVDQVAQTLAVIRQTVQQSHRQELSRRLRQLADRPVGIPSRPGWVVLDAGVPRSPRPGDLRGQNRPRWIVTVEWPGTPPTSLDPH